jgi:hypothetical protein
MTRVKGTAEDTTYCGVIDAHKTVTCSLIKPDFQDSTPSKFPTSDQLMSQRSSVYEAQVVRSSDDMRPLDG